MQRVLLQDSEEHWLAHECEKNTKCWRKNYIKGFEGTVPGVLTDPGTVLVLTKQTTKT